MLMRIRLLFWASCILWFNITYGRILMQSPLTTLSIEPQTAEKASSYDKNGGQKLTNVKVGNLKPDVRFFAKQQTEVDNLDGITTNKSGNSSLDMSDVGVHNSTSASKRHNTHLNLAFIPVVCGFVFVIVVILKCCQWFRQYSQGGSKDNNYMYYAEIVEDGDDGHLDYVSDTTSMAPYDTVSSFASFLRRNNNEGTVTSTKSFKHLHGITDSPRKWLFAKFSQAQMRNQSSDVVSCDDTGTSVQLTNMTRKRTITSGTSSSSNEETEAMETDPLNSSYASILRKQNRFRVSFVTDNDADGAARGTLDSSLTLDQRFPTVLKHTLHAPLCTSNAVICSNKPSTVRNMVEPAMKTIGTQTHKTYRRLLRNAQEPHTSDDRIIPSQSSSSSGMLVSVDVLRTNSVEDNEAPVSSCAFSVYINKDSDSVQQIQKCSDTHKLSDTTQYSKIPCPGNDKVDDIIHIKGRNSGFITSEAEITDDVQTTSNEVATDSLRTSVVMSSSCSQPQRNVDSDTLPDSLSKSHSNISLSHVDSDSRDTHELASTCTHCGRPLLGRGSDHSHQRHSSINSDQLNVSLSSLESSGYADELSFDGSD